MNYLCLDVGTTCTKAQVFDENGNIGFYRSEECPLTEIDGMPYADIRLIVKTVKRFIKDASAEMKIDSVAVSSFGESFVTLDKNGDILTYPMLYTDGRGAEQANRMSEEFGDEYLYGITGVMPHAMYSVYKLLWIKDNMSDLYGKIDKLLLMCDYIGYVLTGKRCIDYALAARTGVFDIRKKEFSGEILAKLGISADIFSEPMKTGAVVGRVSAETVKETGVNPDCVLILGSHDQVCATMGAGVLKSGEASDGMGTVECITSVFDKIPDDCEMGYKGYPVVPYAVEGLYCTYILNLTSGSVVNWFRNKILHGYKGGQKDAFTYLEKDCDKITDVIMLPYFGPSSTPYQDVNAKGCFVNLTLNTSDCDMYRAILESTSYEMKLNLDSVKKYGVRVKSLVATGGGSNSALWLKIKSDVLNVPVKSLRSSEGGLCGLAVISAVALGTYDSYERARNVFVRYKGGISPNGEFAAEYKEKYLKYKKLYKKLKELM